MQHINELLQKKITRKLNKLNLKTVLPKDDSLFFVVPISSYLKLSEDNIYASTRNTCESNGLLENSFRWLISDIRSLKEIRLDLIEELNQLENQIASQETRNKIPLLPSEVVFKISQKNEPIYMNFIGKEDYDINGVNKNSAQCIIDLFLKDTAVNLNELPKNHSLPVLINKAFTTQITKNFINSFKHLFETGSITEAIEKSIKEIDNNFDKNIDVMEEMKESIIKKISSNLHIDEQEVKYAIQVGSLTEWSLTNAVETVQNYINSKNSETDNIFYQMSVQRYSDLPINDSSPVWEYHPIHYIQCLFTSIMLNNMDASKKDRETIYNNIAKIVNKLSRDEGTLPDITDQNVDEFLIKVLHDGTSINIDYSKIESIRRVANPMFNMLSQFEHATQIEFIKLHTDRTIEDGFFLQRSGKFLIPLAKLFETYGLENCTTALKHIESEEKKKLLTINNNFCLSGSDTEISITLSNILKNIHGFTFALKLPETELCNEDKIQLIDYVVNQKNIINNFNDLTNICSNDSIPTQFKMIILEKSIIKQGIVKNLDDIANLLKIRGIDKTQLNNCLFKYDSLINIVKNSIVQTSYGSNISLGSRLQALSKIKELDKGLLNSWLTQDNTLNFLIKKPLDIVTLFKIEQINKDKLNNWLFKVSKCDTNTLNIDNIVKDISGINLLFKTVGIHKENFFDWLYKDTTLYTLVTKAYKAYDLSRIKGINKENLFNWLYKDANLYVIAKDSDSAVKLFEIEGIDKVKLNNAIIKDKVLSNIIDNSYSLNYCLKSLFKIEEIDKVKLSEYLLRNNGLNMLTHMLPRFNKGHINCNNDFIRILNETITDMLALTDLSQVPEEVSKTAFSLHDKIRNIKEKVSVPEKFERIRQKYDGDFNSYITTKIINKHSINLENNSGKKLKLDLSKS